MARNLQRAIAMSIKHGRDTGRARTGQGPVGGAHRVLLVDEDPARTDRLRSALQEAGCDVVAAAPSDEDLPLCVEQAQPDVIIVAMKSSRGGTLQTMHGLARERPIIMFVDTSDSQTTQSAIRAGITAYIVDGLDPNRLKSIMDVAIARFEEQRALRLELEKTRAALNERKIVERAKGLLMKERGLSEDEAYSVLRKQAMAQNRRLVDVAQALLTYADILKPRR